MALFTAGIPWHEGEEKMHTLLGVPEQDNPTAPMLTRQAINMLQRAPLLAVGTLDSENRPWTSIWGGRSEVSRALHEASGLIGTRSIVDVDNDPVVGALATSIELGNIAQMPEKMVSGLAIDLMSRKRVKLFGRVLAVSIDEAKVELVGNLASSEQPIQSQKQIQVVTKIEQSLGNCPKYLNQYELTPTLVSARRILKSPSLSPEVRELMSTADMFFLSSGTAKDMDTNHRGGAPGFVRIISEREFCYPEYSGNRLYQTLGNLQMNPRTGIVFPNYKSGDVVYITGKAQILTWEEAAKILPGSNLVVKITTEEVRFVEAGLPFRGTRKLASPYNPLVRALASEGNIKAAFVKNRVFATLVKRTEITPTIARFTFSVPEGLSYGPGQWIAFDFSKELDFGYSHMRDDDPRSLNDDFVRTFTISSAPSGEDRVRKSFEITLRNVGVVTNLLFKANANGSLQIPILGVGGDFRIRIEKKEVGYFAAGVGITPLLGQIPSLLRTAPLLLRLYWTIQAADIRLVIDTLTLYPELGARTQLYVTRTAGSDAKDQEDYDLLKSFGAAVVHRRITEDDLLELGYQKWYLCAAKHLRSQILEWLQGKDVVFEDFDY